MIENGHFHELQSIVDMLPVTNGSIEGHSQNTQNCTTVSSGQRKKRQTLVFSATIALSADFRKKLKHGALKQKQSMSDGLNSIETLSERAGMRDNVAIVDLTNASIMANKLEESFIQYVPFICYPATDLVFSYEVYHCYKWLCSCTVCRDYEDFFFSMLSFSACQGLCL